MRSANAATLHEGLDDWAVLLPFRLPFERTEWLNTAGNTAGITVIRAYAIG